MSQYPISSIQPTELALAITKEHGVRRDVGDARAANFVTYPNDPAVDDRELPIRRIQDRRKRRIERKSDLRRFRRCGAPRGLGIFFLTSRRRRDRFRRLR